MSTRSTVVASGATALFSVPFPFISRSHVVVMLDGVETTDFTWLSDSTIQFDTVPAAGVAVRMERVTPAAPLVSYVRGSALPLTDLNVDSKQALYRIDELDAVAFRASSDTDVSVSLVAPPPSPMALWGWNNTGTALQNYGADTFLAGVAAGAKFTFPVVAGTTTLDLSGIPSPWMPDWISYRGIVQEPTAWTLSADGNTLTFSEPLPAVGNVVIAAVFISASAPASSELIEYTIPASGGATRSIRTKLAESVSVEDFGAVGDGVTDDSTAITNAIAYVAGLGGGEVRFADKEYAIGTGIVVSSANVYLRGVGYQKHGSVNAAAATRWTQYGGTILKWIGATGAGDTMLSFKPAATGPLLHGVGYEGIILDCDGKASYGLEILSVQGGRFPRVLVADAMTRNIHLGVMPSGPWTSTDPRDLQHTRFGLVMSRSWLAAALSADGILIDGDDVADVSVCQFDEVFYIHKDGVGLTLKSSDALTFDTVFSFRVPGGTGIGVRIDGGVSVTDYPRRHFFGFLQPGAGGLTLTANTVAPDNIVAACYSFGNGTPAPVIGAGCGFTYTSDGGTTRLSRIGTAAQSTAVRPGAVNGNNIDLSEQAAPNSAGTETVYSKQQTVINDNAAGSEDATRNFSQKVAGVDTVVLSLSDGIAVKQGAVLKRLLTATASLDFPSVAAGGGVQAMTIAVPGAQLFDSVVLGMPSNGGTNGLVYHAYVSAADVVTVRATNSTAGALDPAAQTFRVTVLGF